MISELNHTLQAIYRKIDHERHTLPYGETRGFAVEERPIIEGESIKDLYYPQGDRMVQMKPIERLQAWCEASGVHFWRDREKEMVCMTFQTFDNYFYAGYRKEDRMIDRIHLALMDSMMSGCMKERPNILLLSGGARRELYSYIKPWQRLYSFPINGRPETYEGMAIVDFFGGTDGDFALAYRPDLQRNAGTSIPANLNL